MKVNRYRTEKRARDVLYTLCTLAGAMAWDETEC